MLSMNEVRKKQSTNESRDPRFYQITFHRKFTLYFFFLSQNACMQITEFRDLLSKIIYYTPETFHTIELKNLKTFKKKFRYLGEINSS